MCPCGAAVHSLGWVRQSQEMEEIFARSLLYAGPRQGRRCLPRTGEHKTLPADKLLPATFTSHFILWTVSVSVIGAASSSPPSGVLKGKGGSRPDERGRRYCRLGRLRDPFSCSASGSCGGHSLKNSIVFSLIPFLWSCREGSECLGGWELVR